MGHLQLSSHINRRSRKFWIRLLTPLVALAALGMTECQFLKSTFVGGGIGAPDFAVASPVDSRLFVGSRSSVRILDPASGQFAPQSFVDLTQKVSFFNDRGILGLAFSPNFAEDRQVYLTYIDRSEDLHLSRFLAGPAGSPSADQIDLSSEVSLLSVYQVTSRRRGGSLAFGPDGYLYLATGDGDEAEGAQVSHVLWGKILRLDVSGGPGAAYRIPPTNPFASDPRHGRPEVFAVGLRDPHGIFFDPESGDLWIPDRGLQRQEVNRLPAGTGGQNFGWPVHDGSLCKKDSVDLPCELPEQPSAFTFPMAEYASTETSCGAISGGAIRNGTLYFGDDCQERVFLMGSTRQTPQDITSTVTPPSGFGGIQALTRTRANELLLLSGAGQVFRISPESPAPLPAPADLCTDTPSPRPRACGETEEYAYNFPEAEEVTVLALAAYAGDEEPLATLSDLDDYLNMQGYQAKFSVAEQIENVSRGKVRIRFVPQLVQLTKPTADYTSSQIFADDAIEALRGRGFDFDQLSTAESGLYYPFALINAGQAPLGSPHQTSFIRSGFENYSFTYFRKDYEVGVILHELGHSLFGWGEWYTAGMGKNAGTGNFDSMAHGFRAPYNAYLRMCKNWTRVVDIGADRYPVGTKFELPANGPTVLRFGSSERPEEYFLIEAVSKTGQGVDLPDDGLLVWHVDDTMRYQFEENTPAQHNRVGLEQADGRFGMETDPFDRGGAGDAFRSNHVDRFGDNTTPNSRWWDGQSSNLEISSVGPAGPKVSFILGPPGTTQVGPTVGCAETGASSN